MQHAFATAFTGCHYVIFFYLKKAVLIHFGAEGSQKLEHHDMFKKKNPPMRC